MLPSFLLFLIVALLGLAFGSFGNVLLVRLAEGSAITGRSRCPKCRHALAWYDLLPLASYIYLGGRCRHCAKPIAAHYPLVEAGSAALFTLAFILAAQDLTLFAGYALLLWGLLLASLYDARSGLLPDLFTGIIFAGALIIRLHESALMSGLIGFLIGAGWFGWQWAVSRGKAVGSGDILLAGALGVALGVAGTVTMLVASYITGAIIATVLIVTRRATRTSRIPFGPFLAVGTLATLLGIGEWYLRLLG